MQHLVAKIMKREEFGRRTAPSGLTVCRVRLTARIEGPVSSALTVPDRVKGREVTVTRDVPKPWLPRVGDRVVLDPGESARALSPRPARRPEPPVGAGTVALASADVDRDGFDEDLISNAFVEGVVQPHRGARLVSLLDAQGGDRFAQAYEHIMAGKYVLLGGAEDVVVESGMPGELWSASLDREVDDASRSVVYSRRLRSPRGLRFRKRVRVEPDLPGVLTEVTLRYEQEPEGEPVTAGIDGGTEPEDRKDHATVSYAVRLSTAVHGAGSRNVFVLPTPQGMKLVRYHRPPYGSRWRWRDWKNETFGLRAGFILSRNEDTGRAMMLLFSARRSLYVGVLNDLSGPELMLRHRPVRLASGTSRTWGAAFLSGDASAASGSSALLLTRGRSGRELAVTVRTTRRVERLTATLATGGGRRRLTLAPREVPHAGRVFSGVIAGRGIRDALSCRVRVGDDALAAQLEAV